MLKRSILIFPRFAEIEQIQNIRKKHDPLFNHIGTHITLVFPFESSLSAAEIENHIKHSIRNIKPFKLVMRDITGMPDGYLFLNVKVGNDELIRIHDLLYKGILEPYRDRRFTYVPHITVGRIRDNELFNHAIQEYKGYTEEFETIINEITVEIIDEQDHSLIESTIFL